MNPSLQSVRAIAALPVLFVFACGTVAVRVPVMKPAEINMAPYSSVGIGEMRGNYDRPMAGALEEALVSSGRFTVVDRAHMDKVMRELQLSSTDLADPNSAAKLGKVVTAGALIFGDVTHEYREVPSQEHFKDKDGNAHTWNVVKGVFTLHANFRITDVSTGSLIVAKTYDETRDDTNRGLDKRPEAINKDALERAAKASVVERFMKAIVPHQEFQNAMFRKDSDIPQLEGGIGWAERGDWKKAQDTFNTAVQDSEKNLKLKSDQIAKAYFDLGLSYEYAGDYAKARSTIEIAFQKSNDREMLNELDSIKRLEDDARKLSEQTGGAVGGK